MIRRVAFVSVHTSPLATPGTGDGGGMNVYVDALARHLADRGVAVDVFTRRVDRDAPHEIDVAPGYRVINVDAEGSDRAEMIGAFSEGVAKCLVSSDLHPEVIHSHYWLSGWVGALLQDVLGIPLAISFHTLGRVKEASRIPGEPRQSLVRIAAEAEVVARAGCVIASTPAEAADLIEHYQANPERICVSPPGVDHGLFHPGDRRLARERLGLGDRPTVAFVGRIQALKGVDIAVEAVGLLDGVDLIVVGGPSGPSGRTELGRLRALAETVAPGRVRFLPPRPHAEIADVYRGVDALVVPSRSESFGLVAVEAQACGTPVVASAVGGLVYSVADGESGRLVRNTDAEGVASALHPILFDRGEWERLSAGAVIHASQYSWDATTARLLELYRGLLE
ncbi:MAG: glycosyltransferase [Acidimicrobiia bacterium]|nr:MAG: glycosyltransferase [Acidimicrobiia bacterium]